MAINSTTRITTAYTSGNNFVFAFKVYKEEDVKVIQVNTTTKAETVLTLTTNYTVTLNDDQNDNPGGTVTLVSSGNPQNLGSGLNIVITSQVSALQQTEITNQGGFYPEVANDVFDKGVILHQQQQQVLDKTIRFPLTQNVGGLQPTENAAERANKTCVFDANGDFMISGLVDGRDISADGAKLDTIEVGATADQTAAEIRQLVEDATDSNVFTDADHSKLNGIEDNATRDQTAAEIRTLVDQATDSNVFTDGDHTKLDGIEPNATADQTIGEIKSLIAGSPLDASHLAPNSVTISEIEDAELSTLAGMQSGTASKLADSTALTADIADLNQLDGLTKQTTITDTDASFPTSGAVVDYIAAQIAPIGGLEVIATDQDFPNTMPASGVVISIADAGGVVVSPSGVSTTARTKGGATVTINGINSAFANSTVDDGVAFMVSSTGANNVYDFHKATLREADILSISGTINDFAERYRVGAINPVNDLDEGDLFFNTATNKFFVYNGTIWDEVQSVGNFYISGFNEAIDGNRQDFTINNAPADAQQLILSINGVIQKPNSGNNTPSEGFALAGNIVKLASPPPQGSSVFITVMGSTVDIGTPSANTVTSAILQNGSVQTAKLADQAVTLDKLLHGDANSDGKFLRANNGADPTFETIDLTNLSGSNLTSGTIPAARFGADTIATGSLAAGALPTDVTISDANISGNLTIESADIVNGTIVDADISGSAAIALSKLATGALPTGITVTSANISDLSIVNADINASAAIALSKLATGALPTGITIASANIVDGSIVDGDINASANIAGSKLANDSVTLDKLGSGALPTDITVASANIVDGTIVNADINASAAIAGTKISPVFGSQNISTSGSLILSNSSTSPEINFTGSGPNFLRFNDSAETDVGLDFVWRDTPNTLAIEKKSDQTVLWSINHSGQATIANNLDVGAGIDVTGNITVTGTVDGVDIAALNTTVSNLSLSGNTLANGTTATTQAASDATTKVATTAFVGQAVTNLIDSSPSALNTLNELAAALGDDANFSTTVTNSIATKLPLAGGQITGNITCSGSQTFDGRDLSVDGAKLDGIEAGATGDQTNAEIRAAVEAASDSNVFTDADHSKLNGIEASATADQTAAEIRALVNSASDSNVLTDALLSKLNGIETSATADQSNSEIKTAYEANSDTNAFTDALLSKLNGIAASATNVTNNNQLTNGAGYITAAQAAAGNATTLDGLDSTQFLRADANDTFTGTLTWSGTSGHTPLNFSASDGYPSFRVIQNSTSSGNYADGMYIGYANANSGRTRIYGGGATSGGLDVRGSGVNDVKINGNTVWHAGNDGSGSELDADRVDGIQASSFLRADTDDICYYRITFENNESENEDTIATSTGYQGGFEIKNSGVGNDAFMAFHAGGDFACYFGLDADINDIAVGGWSMGANKYRVWHAGNDGSGSGLDADTVDGIQASNFLRSDTNDTMAGSLTVRDVIISSGYTLQRSNHHTGHLEGSYNNVGANSYKSNPIYTIGSSYNPADASLGNMYGVGYTNVNASFISFTGASGWGFYVASDGDARVWLDGSNGVISSTGQHYVGSNVVWNAGNDGAGSGLDADLLDGLQLSSSATANTVVQRNSSGYVFANYFNTTPNTVTSGVTQICVETGNDGYIRHGTAAAVRAFLNVADGATAGSGLPTTGGTLTGTLNARHIYPSANNTYDLGSTSYRWRNIYTGDLNLSNEGSSNDVDGTFGSYTIQEGHHDLFLINKRTGKKYKFNLTEVS